jgi:hypothetical protein
MSDDEYKYPNPEVAAPNRQPWELPLTIVAVAFFVTLVAETFQLVDERWRLADLQATQAPQVQQSMKFREQLQSLASETARLADGGDAAAKKIVEVMRQQGVTLKVDEK